MWWTVIIESKDEKEIKEMYDQLYKKIENLKEEDTYKGKRKILNNISKELDELSNNTHSMEDLNKINKKLNIYEKTIKAIQATIDLDPGRLMGLTDGIFGMVMTLLIFGVSLPEIGLSTNASFITFITELLPTIGITIISFILLSTFWIFHHEFIKINKINIPYLWFNILFLINISFIPLSTSMIGYYSKFFISEVIFGLNIFSVLISFTIMYSYAYRRNLFENEPTKKERKYVLTTLVIVMLLTLIIITLNYSISSIYIYLFLLIPIITTIRDIRYKI